ncbi:hypothetical protein PORY_000520 [Pneumocystis oryctolagi]|uniref:Uncharacterized protein n=1 Tax=Pneumocystis oryctolagi TaxID=42067 RepID=A0ACB7CGY6_9ASCO|nr:hypothetical protein PORY_000520 [Pneumocystis oryctolagi]
MSSPFKFIIKYKHDQKRINLHPKSYKTSFKDEKNEDSIHEKQGYSNKFIHIQKFKDKKDALYKETEKLSNSLIKWKNVFNEDTIQSNNEKNKKKLTIIPTNTSNISHQKEMKNPFIVYDSNKIIKKNINRQFLPYIFSNFKQKILDTKPIFSFIKTPISSSNITKRENTILNWTPSKKRNVPLLEKGLAKMVLNWVIEYQSQNTLRNYSNIETKENIFIVTETKKDRYMNNIYFYGYEKFTENIKILFLLTGRPSSQNEINEGELLSLYEPITRFENIFSQDIIICIHWGYYKNVE